MFFLKYYRKFNDWLFDLGLPNLRVRLFSTFSGASTTTTIRWCWPRWNGETMAGGFITNVANCTREFQDWTVYGLIKQSNYWWFHNKSRLWQSWSSSEIHWHESFRLGETNLVRKAWLAIPKTRKPFMQVVLLFLLYFFSYFFLFIHLQPHRWTFFDGWFRLNF